MPLPHVRRVRTLPVALASGGATARPWQLDLSDNMAEARLLVDSEANHKRPMPYGAGADARIAFLADRDGRFNLWSVNAGGGDFEHQRTRWLAKAQDFLTETALAPDGERVALTVRGRNATVGPADLRRAEAPLPPEARCREGQFSHAAASAPTSTSTTRRAPPSRAPMRSSMPRSRTCSSASPNSR